MLFLTKLYHVFEFLLYNTHSDPMLVISGLPDHNKRKLLAPVVIAIANDTSFVS